MAPGIVAGSNGDAAPDTDDGTPVQKQRPGVPVPPKSEAVNRFQLGEKPVSLGALAWPNHVISPMA